jgi:hypothetical protein
MHEGGLMTARARLLTCLLPLALAGPACDVGISAGGFEGTFDRSLTVSGPLELEVTSGSGNIYVRTGPDGEVQVHGRVRVSGGPWASLSGRSAEDRIREIERNPPIVQTGNRIEIGPRRGTDGWNGISVSYEIVVPANARVEARSGSGDLEVADVTGPVEVSTGSGDINLGRIKDDVTARTGSGDIELEGAASARTSTGSGSVIARAVRGDLDARSGSGDIIAEQHGKGSVEVSTGSGNIELTGATGPLHVRASSGDITLEGTPASDWDVSASSGSVRLRLPSKGGFDLDLRSSSGRIESAVPISVTGSQSRREIKGQVRGGGPRVHVSTSSGGIVVQ